MTASLLDILQKETICLFRRLLFLNLFVAGGSGRSDALCHHPRAACGTGNLLSSGANYSSSQACAGWTFASLCDTETNISDFLGDESAI